jgi:hypothetical protein
LKYTQFQRLEGKLLGPKLKIAPRPKKRGEGGENNIKKGETFVLTKPTRPNQPNSIKKKRRRKDKEREEDE